MAVIHPHPADETTVEVTIPRVAYIAKRIARDDDRVGTFSCLHSSDLVDTHHMSGDKARGLYRFLHIPFELAMSEGG